MATDFVAVGGGGAKRRRVDARAAKGEEAAALPAIRISALPDELRQRILAHLPLKEAIRTGALALGWRDLWKSRWIHCSSVEIHLRSRDDVRRELGALPRPRRRLDRFSLIVDICKLSSSELRCFLDYAAECRVEVLHVETRKSSVAENLNFHLPLSSPFLASLSLRRINVAKMYYKGAQPFHALEVIRLHFVSITATAFMKMMALCPNLRALDLRGCDCGLTGCSITWSKLSFLPTNVRSVTVAECDGTASLEWAYLPKLHSFLYRGSFLDAPFSLPGDATLANLYICLGNSISECYGIMRFNRALPDDLSGLTVLTICSNALPAASPFPDDGVIPQLPKLSNLYSLRELQLLMLDMLAANLADIYVFLKTCRCANLERLFVHLPKSESYDPMEATLDEVGEEPTEVALDNLKIVKVMNFNWRHIEVQLVSFLLRKATSLHKLLLVSPNVSPLNAAGVQEADLLLLKEALDNGKIMLSESDDAATQPYHSEVFIEV
ncbi:hypothetical protein EJB05_11625 [Eragrostis curvula]|uniref:F-box domain-containing protein n=1 Tax=Eragrostis curvula TaxID=38414 RepID=A0A5J9VRU0_9POAL|nr:hypothetical protein EJB05_11625 [Eragrostis curvula]